MSALQQLQEYRKKQAERFQNVDDEEDPSSEEDIQEIAHKYDEQERIDQEQRDLQFSQNLERNMNFRDNYTHDLEENKFGENYDDIGYEGTPAQVPSQNQNHYMNEGQLGFGQNNRETITRKEPPRWLVNPIHIDRNTEIKVFDFTEGSTNQELRMTADSSVNYEYDTMPDPNLRNHNAKDLEIMLHEKQKKRLDKFEQQEDLRVEEAKRNGIQVEESKSAVASDDNNGGINAPLLAGNEPVPQGAPQPAGQNNQNLGQNRTIIPGLLIRQANGHFRVC